MDIEYPCPNCGEEVRAAGAAAGTSIVCSRCGATIIIREMEPVQPAATSEPAESLSLADLPPLPPDPQFSTPRDPELDRRGRMGPFATDCLMSLGFAVRDLGNIIMLLIVYILVALVAGLAFRFLGRFLLFTGPGRLFFSSIAMVMWLAIFGYFGQYYLGVIDVSADGDKQRPTAPDWDIGRVLWTGLRSMGLCCIYVFPIVTIPLLPLGVMALAHSGDGRGYNLFWAFRAALKRPGELLLLWAMLLFWTLVTLPIMILLGFIMGTLSATIATSYGPAEEFAMGLVVQLVVGATGLLILTVFCRCIGCLGYHYPRLLEALPGKRGGVPIGFVGLGLLLTIAVWGMIIPQVDGAALERRVEWMARGGSVWSRTDGREDVADGQPSPPSGRHTPVTPAPRVSPGPTPTPTPGLLPNPEDRLRSLYAVLRSHAGPRGGRFPNSPVEVGLSPADYIFVPGTTIASPRGDILAYDPTVYHDRPGGQQLLALLVDGRVVAFKSVLDIEQKIRSQDPFEQAKTAIGVVAAKLAAWRKANPGKLPASLADIGAGALRPPGQAANGYKVVDWLGPEASADAVWAYDPATYAGGRRLAIRLDGTVAVLTDAQLVFAVQRPQTPEAALRQFHADCLRVAGTSGRFPDRAPLSAAGTGKYVYVPGKTADSPDHLLAYDPQARTDKAGKRYYLAVRVDGGLVMFTARGDIDTRLIAENPTMVRWSVPWPDLDPKIAHPFRNACQSVKKVRPAGTVEIAGIAFGPAAASKDDKAYADFRKAVAGQYDTMLKQVRNMGAKRTAPQKWGGVDYDRTVAYRGGLQVTVLVGLEKGRCVAYWFVGTNDCFLNDFAKGIGKTALKLE